MASYNSIKCIPNMNRANTGRKVLLFSGFINLVIIYSALTVSSAKAKSDKWDENVRPKLVFDFLNKESSLANTADSEDPNQSKLENQMQKLRATMKKEALFYDFWWHFWPKKLVPFNHCALTWQYWWQKSHERSSSRRTLLYFTCYYYILWIWSWKNSRYFPYFVFKRFSINNGCCLDPLQITDLYNNLSISVRVCVQTLSPPPVLVRFEL